MKSLVLGIALLAVSLAARAATPADPWSLVRALPTACYGKQDDFDEVVAQRIATLNEEIGRQDNINGDITNAPSAQLHAGKVDPWEMSRRMTENMMKDPKNAMKSVQAANESVAPNRQANLEQEEQGARAEEGACRAGRTLRSRIQSGDEDD
jgi:hypothetical protein